MRDPLSHSEPAEPRSGLVVMILLVPVTRTFMRKMRGFQRSIMKYTDDRIKKTQEVCRSGCPMSLWCGAPSV